MRHCMECLYRVQPPDLNLLLQIIFIWIICFKTTLYTLQITIFAQFIAIIDASPHLI